MTLSAQAQAEYRLGFDYRRRMNIWRGAEWREGWDRLHREIAMAALVGRVMELAATVEGEELSMAKTKKSKAAAKSTARRRSAISGRYGSGAKEAEKLARRILKVIDDNWFVGRDAAQAKEREAVLVPVIKGELLAATTVRETAKRRR